MITLVAHQSHLAWVESMSNFIKLYLAFCVVKFPIIFGKNNFKPIRYLYERPTIIPDNRVLKPRSYIVLTVADSGKAKKHENYTTAFDAHLFTAHQRSSEGNVFSCVSGSLSVHGRVPSILGASPAPIRTGAQPPPSNPCTGPCHLEMFKLVQFGPFCTGTHSPWTCSNMFTMQLIRLKRWAVGIRLKRFLFLNLILQVPPRICYWLIS